MSMSLSSRPNFLRSMSSNVNPFLACSHWPGGRPRLLTWDIETGVPRPNESRSSVIIASSTTWRSERNSESIW
jgi:hypothetical protein